MDSCPDQAVAYPHKDIVKCPDKTCLLLPCVTVQMYAAVANHDGTGAYSRPCTETQMQAV